MQLALARILLLQIFLSCSGFSITVFAEEYDQFELDLILAKRGDSDAQFSVAGAYEEGREVPKDLAKAFYWYGVAAKNKHNDAQYKLGEFYENGWGVEVDKKEAQFWYKQAQQNGSRLFGYQTRPVVSKRIETSAKAKNEEMKRHAADEKSKKEKQRQLAASARRERDAYQAKLRDAARQKKVVQVQDKAAVSAKYMQLVLKNNWYSKAVKSVVLPSSLNNCLQSSDTELVCFSREQQAVIGRSRIVFTTKSIIHDFSYTGDFTVSYYFNVVNVYDATVKGNASDPLGLRAEKGWQEPRQSMQCNISNTKELKCMHNGRNYFFRH